MPSSSLRWTTPLLAFALAHLSLAAEKFPGGWETAAPREEIPPPFSYDAKGGPHGKGALVMRAEAPEEHGWFQKLFPVEGESSCGLRRSDGPTMSTLLA